MNVRRKGGISGGTPSVSDPPTTVDVKFLPCDATGAVSAEHEFMSDNDSPLAPKRSHGLRSGITMKIDVAPPLGTFLDGRSSLRNMANYDAASTDGHRHHHRHARNDATLGSPLRQLGFRSRNIDLTRQETNTAQVHFLAFPDERNLLKQRPGKTTPPKKPDEKTKENTSYHAKNYNKYGGSGHSSSSSSETDKITASEGNSEAESSSGTTKNSPNEPNSSTGDDDDDANEDADNGGTNNNSNEGDKDQKMIAPSLSPSKAAGGPGPTVPSSYDFPSTLQQCANQKSVIARWSCTASTSFQTHPVWSSIALVILLLLCFCCSWRRCASCCGRNNRSFQRDQRGEYRQVSAEFGDPFADDMSSHAGDDDFEDDVVEDGDLDFWNKPPPHASGIEMNQLGSDTTSKTTNGNAKS